MELELKRNHLAGYELIADMIVCQEETLETIVPDACPDIMRLIDTQGKVFLKNKVASDGKVVLSGTARLTVLYQPDTGTGPCCLEVNIPYQVAVEDKNVHTGCLIHTGVRIASADTRTINPRKIVTRVELVAKVNAFAASETAMCSGVDVLDGSVEQLLEGERCFCISAVQEKQISFEDDLLIPAGRSAAAELISSQVELSCHETKLIGNKLIMKGNAVVQILYRPTGGGLEAADFTLPISQIVEVLGVGEDGRCDVTMGLSGAEFLLGEDGRKLSASISLLAQIVVMEERSVTLLADTYSTGASLQVTRAPFEFQTCRVEGLGHQLVREVIETGIPVRTVIFSYCTVGRTLQRSEGSERILEAQIEITSICTTEDGEYCSISRGIDTEYRIESLGEDTCFFSCRCGTVSAVPTADGVEVRLTLDFPYRFMRKEQAVAVRDVVISECSAGEEEPASIILRVLGPGERLWDVAKRYQTTIADIVKVNELESEQPEEGTLLLIPRKR